MADTLELADGTILQGDFVGTSNGIVMFNTGDSVEAYPEIQVVGIFLSDGSGDCTIDGSSTADAVIFRTCWHQSIDSNGRYG